MSYADTLTFARLSWASEFDSVRRKVPRHLRRLAVQQIVGGQELPRKPAIADYFNLQFRTVLGMPAAILVRGHYDYWTRTCLITAGNRVVDLMEVVGELGWYSYYSGPGRGFSHDAVVERNHHSILVRQSGGLDV